MSMSFMTYLNKGTLSPFDAYYKILDANSPLAAFRVGGNVKLLKVTTEMFGTILKNRPNLFIGVYNDLALKSDFMEDFKFAG